MHHARYSRGRNGTPGTLTQNGEPPDRGSLKLPPVGNEAHEATLSPSIKANEILLALSSLTRSFITVVFSRVSRPTKFAFHCTPLNAVAFSPDVQWLASAREVVTIA